MRLLLVDDEMDFVSTLAERLEMRGIDVDWSASPEDAIGRAETECYDIAVLDMKMPRLSGLDLKKAIQKSCPETRFIFLTGHGCEQSFREATQETGEDCYLLKPIPFEYLLAKIQEVRSNG
jgi:DNA-binding response OmpR family regulator